MFSSVSTQLHNQQNLQQLHLLFCLEMIYQFKKQLI